VGAWSTVILGTLGVPGVENFSAVGSILVRSRVASPPPVSPPDPLSQGPKMLRLGAAAKIEVDFHKTANSDYIADLNVILML